MGQQNTTVYVIFGSSYNYIVAAIDGSGRKALYILYHHECDMFQQLFSYNMEEEIAVFLTVTELIVEINSYYLISVIIL